MTATLTETPVDEAVDLSDLDMLDDEHRHARCCLCWPVEYGVPFKALCGRTSVWLSSLPDPTTIPPNACPDCRAVFGQPCGAVHR